MEKVERDGATRNLIERVLHEVFPEECATVGLENVADIAAGVRFDDEGGGNRNIVVEAIHVLASAATLVGLYLQWRDTRPSPDAAAEAELIATAREIHQIELAKRLEIYRLLERLEDEE